MNVNNFINFSILFSCFMGAFFSILKFTHAIDIVLSFLMISFCLSIILKFGISLIVKYTDVKKEKHFSHDYDAHLEDLRLSMNNLEKISRVKIGKIHDLNIEKITQRRKATAETIEAGNE